MEVKTETGSGWKNVLVVVYISFMVHMYILLAAMTGMEPIQKQAAEKKQPDEVVIENIIIEQEKPNLRIPKTGFIAEKAHESEKPAVWTKETMLYSSPDNTGYAPVAPETRMPERPKAIKGNRGNPKKDKNRSDSGDKGLKTGDQDKTGDNLSIPAVAESGTKIKDGNRSGGNDGNRSDVGGDTDGGNQDKKGTGEGTKGEIVINMDDSGGMDLSTIPADYAPYFYAMERKISETWNQFFPVHQYYMGILKDGDVVIQFRVNANGDVVSPTLTQSYGYEIVDRASMNAIVYSRNFGPLPEGLKQHGEITVNFKFMYILKEE